MIKAKFVGKMYQGFNTGDTVNCEKVSDSHYKTYGYSNGKYHCFILPAVMISIIT